MKRDDDFKERRVHLADLSETELEERFWALSEKLVEPIIELGYKNTSPSIERSVLLRMGFSSIEAKGIVDNSIDRGLIGKGAGQIVYKLSLKKGISIREAGLLLVEGKAWDEVKPMFAGGVK
jgi:D-ornithine 4,5-aminomutase subunit alpha